MVNWERRTRLLWERAEARVLARLPLRELTDPVFIVGCGRSGTTVFGSVLGKHPDIAYLNEPRHLWAAAFPSTDIWSRLATVRGGQLRMSSVAAEPARSRMLRRIFHWHLVRGGRRVLLEKTPINSFRLPFLQAIFPHARFIYLKRNARDVANSIAREVERGRWYGVNDFKWHNLVKSIADRDLRETALSAATPYERGLIEWRLCADAIGNFRAQFPTVAFLHIDYDEFVAEPVSKAVSALEFMRLPYAEAVERFCLATVRRRAASTGDSAPTPREVQLVGDAFGVAR